MLKFKQLRYFIAIAESSSFSKAAQKLFITQPALSQQMSKLEEQLGVKLLERNTRSFQLTAAGWDLYHHAMHLMRELENTVNSVLTTDSLGFINETIRIALEDNIFSLQSTGAFEFLQKAQSMSELTVECIPVIGNSLQQNITNGSCDMGISYLTGHASLTPNLSEKCFHRGYLALAVPKGWCTDFTAPEFMEAIDRASLCYPVNRSYWHGVMNSLMTKYNYYPKAIPISNYECAVNYVIAGNSLFFAPEIQLCQEASDYFDIVTIRDPLAEYRVSIIYATRNESLLLHQILDLLPKDPAEQK